MSATATAAQSEPATTIRARQASWPDRKLFGLIAAVALLFGVYALPAPAPLERAGNLIPLSAHGQTCLAIMAFAVTLWVTEAVPFAVTSLLVLLLIPSFGIADYRTVVRSGFGDPIITFFIGVLILSAAFTRSGLGTRLVYHILQRVGTRTDRVLLGFLVVGVLISMWITKMAVAAMLLPIGIGILRDAEVQPLRSNFGRVIMIAVAFGPLIGGIATPVGTAANLVAIAQLKQLAHTDVSFGRWMLYGLPACVLMVPVAWKLLLWMFPPEIEVLPITTEQIRTRLDGLGPLSPNERRTIAVFAVAIAAWILTPVIESWTGGRIALPAEAVGLAAGLSLFLPGLRVLTWKEAEHDIEWGGIMLIVAGLSLGTVIFDSGAARWLAWVLLGHVSSVPGLLRPFVIVLGVGVLRLMFSSNTVAASIITPILVALARDLHLDAWTIVAPAAFSATLGFILVSQGPTTIIPYGAGYFSIKDMAKAGAWMTIAAAACIAVSIGAVSLLSPALLSAAAAVESARCDSLATRSAPGLTITSAQAVTAGQFPRFTSLPAFCRVEATLKPSDDSEIKTEVWLPIDAGYRAVHEMTAEAKAIVAAYYGRPPRLSYWNGCSLGAPGSERGTASEFALIHAAVLDACDGLDGVKDRLIENPQVCHFDPQALSCQSLGKNDADSGACLTAVLFPGLEPGSELGWAALAGAQPENNALDMFKFVVFKDAAWDWRTFDLAPALAAADKPEHQVLNAVDPNLRPFFARGGKLLMYHGWADPQTPPQNSIRYQDRVSAVAGGTVAAGSMRLFMVPGMGHCEGGEGTDTFDKAAPLDAWVAQGEAPSRIIAAHMTVDTFERTRPLCAYPTVARWTGQGSTNDAANFTCVAP